MPLDQSLVFDAGYRMACGQVPFRDFVIPYGLTVFPWLAVGFTWWGVSYHVYVFLAAAGNVIAVLLAHAVARACWPEQRLMPLLGAGVTACTFYSLFGTWYPEQTASLYGLGAVWCAVRSGESSRGRGHAFTLAAGLLCGLACLAKQNVGTFLSPLIVVLAAISAAESCVLVTVRILAVGAGAAGVIAGIVGWISVVGNEALFWRYFVEIPGEVGRTRLALQWESVAIRTILGSDDINVRLASSVLVLGSPWAVTAVVLGLCNRRTSEGRRMAVAGTLSAGVLLYQNLVITSAANHPLNSLGLVGAASAVLGGLCLAGVRRYALRPIGDAAVWRGVSSRLVTGAVVGVFCLYTLATGAVGVRESLTRAVHDIFARSTFTRRCDVPLLGEISWGEPTAYRGVVIRCAELTQLEAYLRERGGRFAVLGDFSILHAMRGTPSPLPLVWYHRGLTYAETYDRRLDEWMVRQLQAAGVDTLVLEDRLLTMSGDELLGDFPEVQRLLRDEFEERPAIGGFRLLVRRSRASPADD
jgi:hypothetical protein